MRPHSRTRPHTNGLCSPQPPAGGGPGGGVGGGATRQRCPVPIPSPSRPHPVPIPWPCRGRTAVTHPAGTGGGGPGQGEDGALPCDELTASSSPRDEVRGCGQHRGSPDVPCPPQRHLQLCWLPGVGRGGGAAQPPAPPPPQARIHRLHPALTPHCLGVLQGMGAAHARSLCAPSPPPTPLHCCSNPALHPWDSKRYQQLRVLQPGGGAETPQRGGEEEGSRGHRDRRELTKILSALFHPPKPGEGAAGRGCVPHAGGRWGHARMGT